MATTLSPAEKDLFKIVNAIRQLTEGRTNAVGSVTLGVNVASTAVSAVNCAVGSSIFMFPQTLNAAIATTTSYVQPVNVTRGQFIVSHTSTAASDRAFFWVALG